MQLLLATFEHSRSGKAFKEFGVPWNCSDSSSGHSRILGELDEPCGKFLSRASSTDHAFRCLRLTGTKWVCPKRLVKSRDIVALARQ